MMGRKGEEDLTNDKDSKKRWTDGKKIDREMD